MAAYWHASPGVKSHVPFVFFTAICKTSSPATADTEPLRTRQSTNDKLLNVNELMVKLTLGSAIFSQQSTGGTGSSPCQRNTHMPVLIAVIYVGIILAVNEKVEKRYVR